MIQPEVVVGLLTKILNITPNCVNNHLLDMILYVPVKNLSVEMTQALCFTCLMVQYGNQ